MISTRNDTKRNSIRALVHLCPTPNQHVRALALFTSTRVSFFVCVCGFSFSFFHVSMSLWLVVRPKNHSTPLPQCNVYKSVQKIIKANAAHTRSHTLCARVVFVCGGVSLLPSRLCLRRSVLFSFFMRKCVRILQHCTIHTHTNGPHHMCVCRRNTPGDALGCRCRHCRRCRCRSARHSVITSARTLSKHITTHSSWLFICS